MGILTAHAEGTPACNFKNCARVPIDSLKVHFSPKQAGSGEPAPNNVREITGWNNVKVYSSGKNLAHVIGYSTRTITSPTSARVASNSYGTSIDTTLSSDKLVITQSQWPDSSNKLNYTNGYIAIGLDNLQYDAYYDISFKVTNIVNNPLNATLQDLGLAAPRGSRTGPYEVKDNVLIYKNIQFRQSSTYPNEMDFDLRICGMSFTLSEFMITLSNTNDGVFEPYQGNIIPVTFPPVGKNLLDPNNYYFAGTGVLAFGGNASSSIPDGSIYLKAGTYTFSCNVTCNALGGSYGTGGTLGMASNATSFTFTLKSDNTVRLFIVKNNATEEDFQSYHYQLEKNSTATTYEPYNTTVYGGYIDIAKGELVQTHKKVVLNDSTKWTGSATTGNYFVRSYGDPMPDRKTGDKYIITSSIAPSYYTNASYWVQWNKDNAKYPTLWWDTTQVTPTPVEDLQTLSANNAIEICYPLATPITYPLTPIQLSTFLGQNSIYSNTNSLTEVDYALYESAQIRAAKARIMANEPHLATINSSIASFNTDMRAPLRECKAYFSPVQEGTGDPSPDNVRPISGWTGLTVYRTGKNLFDEANADSYERYIQDAGSANPKWTASADSISFSFKATKSTQYTIKGNNTSLTIFRIGILNTDPQTVSAKNVFLESAVNTPDSKIVTITTPDHECWIIIQYNKSIAINRNGQVQIELGSTPTAYTLYNGTTIPVSFPATTNLFNEQWEQGNIEVGNDAGSSTAMRTNFINVNPSTSYYLYTSRENNVFIFEYLEDGTYANKVNSVYTSHTFTTGSTTKKIRIVDRNSGTETVNTGINYPATITYYEPYGTIYGGYIDLIKGELVQTHGCIFNSTKASNLTHLNDGFWYTTDSELQVPAIKGLNAGLITNRLKAINNVGGNSPDGTITWYANGIIRWREHRDLSLTDYQAYLAENPLQLVYELATPITYQLTPTQLKTLRGTNNIWSNANGNIELKYFTH